MKDYILYLSFMVIGACVWNVWSHIKYLETRNNVLQRELLRLIQERIDNDSDMALRERDSGTACE
jgi:hypothetical protein